MGISIACSSVTRAAYRRAMHTTYGVILQFWSEKSTGNRMCLSRGISLLLCRVRYSLAGLAPRGAALGSGIGTCQHNRCNCPGWYANCAVICKWNAKQGGITMFERSNWIWLLIALLLMALVLAVPVGGGKGSSRIAAPSEKNYSGTVEAVN